MYVVMGKWIFDQYYYELMNLVDHQYMTLQEIIDFLEEMINDVRDM